MTILIGLVLAAVLLYGWLVGNWFFRVLTFLGMCVFIFMFAFGAAGPNGAPLGQILVAWVVAWFVSGIPTYYWRRRNLMWEVPRG